MANSVVHEQFVDEKLNDETSRVIVSGREKIRVAFENAEDIFPAGIVKHGSKNSPYEPHFNEILSDADPIVPLGHKSGIYYFISPSGELRSMKAESLEAGRGVKSLFCGVSEEIEDWCYKRFSNANGDWSQKDAGHWIIKTCNARGIFDPATTDLRSIGVWCDGSRNAFAHCGDILVSTNGGVISLADHKAKYVVIGAAPITQPAGCPASTEEMTDILERIRIS